MFDPEQHQVVFLDCGHFLVHAYPGYMWEWGNHLSTLKCCRCDPNVWSWHAGRCLGTNHKEP